jgi:hypothetical protein
VLPAGYALFFGREPKKAREPVGEAVQDNEKPQLALAAE